MHTSFQKKRVLVTGGGRGLGRAMAMAMAERGADIAVAGRTRSQLDETVDALATIGARAVAIESDLYDVAAGRDLVRAVQQQLGGLDVLVNNAGGWGSTVGAVGPILEATVEGFDAVFDLNVRSPLFATIEAAQVMVEQGSGGCVLNIASVDGLAPAPTEALYAAAKSAVLSLTRTLAYELGTHGIRVNAIAPGIIETEMTAPWISTPEQWTERASFYPLNRLGKPDDIASAAVYLCSDEASWVTGVTLPVCGGQFATSDIFRWTRSHNPVPEQLKI